MKKSLLSLAALSVCAVYSSAQLVTLALSDSDIRVGEIFTIDVIVDKTTVAAGAELLSFAFDETHSATVAFLDATVSPPFSDDSAFIPFDVGGSVFPGLPDPSFTIATLTYRALAETMGSVFVLGPVDPFGGLKYTTFDPAGPFGPSFLDEDFPIDAAVRFAIGPGGIIPEPSTIGLLGIGFVLALLSGRRRC